MSDNSNIQRLDWLGVLFIVFLTLKLCGLIDWSWWWVTAPLWIPSAIVLVIILFAFIIIK